jgi:hypothetical protein
MALNRRNLNTHAMQMAAVLSDHFKNPFPQESREWFRHERLIEETCYDISNMPLKQSKIIERAKILGKLEELVRRLEEIRLRAKLTACK